MLNFRKAEIGDKQEIDDLLKACKSPSLEYNFTTFFLWQKQFNMEFAIEDEILFIRSGKTKKSYLFPCGTGNIDRAVDLLLSEGAEFYSLSEKEKNYLEKKAPGRFDFFERRDDGDYIYTAESLKYLKGKKLSSKRNHINRFIAENPDWKYENMTEDNIDEVIKMHKIWCKNAEVDERPGLSDETIAVKTALEHFEELKLSGGLIRTGGRVVAFSVGDRLSSDTFLVHIEKAFGEITGAYQIINREFVLHNCDGYEFINREDDAGDEGLRKAKLSYKPYAIIKKYKAKEKVK